MGVIPRVICERCRRPEVVCYCRHVTPLPTRTRVVILQHPRERDVPINTARIAALCLPNAELHVGLEYKGSLEGAALLYPGPGAIDIEQHPPRGPITLFVVDGTWHQAKKLVRTNPAIAALPRYAFRPDAPSEYRIRREPQADYVSTIEALVRVLGVLEGDPERFQAMLAPFRAMVDTQLAYVARGGGTRHSFTRKERIRERRAVVPAILRERADDLVCVYGEANAWPYGSPEKKASPDELVQWVAVRPATGERFEAFVAPRGRIAPSTSFHARVDEAWIADGMDAPELAARWAEFARPSDVVCSWGTYASKLFSQQVGVLAKTRIDLRVAARVFASARFGTTTDFLARLGTASAEPLGAGRAGVRLAEIVAIARALAAAV